jgi:uncharacterized SAM-binding protein YcdF (DUF218 family)
MLLIVLAGLGWWAVSNVGGWLIVTDPLKHARAIVVLSGQFPYRAMGAADLYHQGWAPEVWITTGYDPAADRTLAHLGIAYTHEWEYDEVREVAATLRQTRANYVIIVTSPLHTRRVRTIWHLLVGDRPQAIVRYDSYENHSAARWWRTTSEGDDVIHEMLGLLNARLGFVAQPKDVARASRP